MDAARLPPPLPSPLHPPHLTRVLASTRLAFDLACVMSVGDSGCPSVSVLVTHLSLISITAVHCVAFCGEIYKDVDSVSISITTQRHATQRAAAVMEISLYANTAHVSELSGGD